MANIIDACCLLAICMAGLPSLLGAMPNWIPDTLIVSTALAATGITVIWTAGAVKATICRTLSRGACAQSTATSKLATAFSCSESDLLAVGVIGALAGERESVATSAIGVHSRVRFTLTLMLEYAETGLPGSAERAIFTRALLKDLSTATSMQPPRFEIMRILPGSILDDLDILEFRADGPDVADLTNIATQLKVAHDLQTQAAHPTSPLCKGTLTRHIARLDIHRDDAYTKGDSKSNVMQISRPKETHITNPQLTIEATRDLKNAFSIRRKPVLTASTANNALEPLPLSTTSPKEKTMREDVHHRKSSACQVKILKNWLVT